MRAVAHYFQIQRRRSPSGHLVTRRVEHIVGIFILAVHALDLSEIVAARSMLFPLSVVEGPLVVL